MKGQLILGLCLLLGICNSYSQVKRELPDDQAIREWMEEYKTPCVAIGTILDGQVSEIKIVSSTEGTQRLNTIFNVASLTKPVVAMTVLRLVTLGKWDLDEPLYHY